MPATDALLPSNATPLERELARLSTPLAAINPAVIETIWDAWRCPSPLLPWLAWAMSVDHWDETWSEIAKRQSIADSPDYHRRKGTRAAVEALLTLGGAPFEIHEWHEVSPPGRRGTANIHIEAALADIAMILRKVRPLVMTSKPKSRAVFFGVGEKAAGGLSLGAAILEEQLVIVDPYAFIADAPEGVAVLSYGLLAEELITVEAHP